MNNVISHIIINAVTILIVAVVIVLIIIFAIWWIKTRVQMSLAINFGI